MDTKNSKPLSIPKNAEKSIIKKWKVEMENTIRTYANHNKLDGRKRWKLVYGNF